MGIAWLLFDSTSKSYSSAQDKNPAIHCWWPTNYSVSFSEQKEQPEGGRTDRRGQADSELIYKLTTLSWLDCHFVYGPLISFMALLNNLVYLAWRYLGDRLGAAALESITVRSECGLEQWQLVFLTKATSFLSSSKSLSFFLFPPFSAPHWREGERDYNTSGPEAFIPNLHRR